jgi:hypothetical protein
MNHEGLEVHGYERTYGLDDGTLGALLRRACERGTQGTPEFACSVIDGRRNTDPAQRKEFVFAGSRAVVEQNDGDLRKPLVQPVYGGLDVSPGGIHPLGEYGGGPVLRNEGA